MPPVVEIHEGDTAEALQAAINEAVRNRRIVTHVIGNIDGKWWIIVQHPATGDMNTIDTRGWGEA